MFSSETILFSTGARSNYRIPTIVTTNNGTVLAFCNDRRDTLSDHARESLLVCARKRPGQLWEEVRVIDSVPGWGCMIGAAVHDRETDTTFVSCRRSPARDEFGKFTDEEIAEMDRKADEEARAMGILHGDILFKSADCGETWTESTFDITPRPFQTVDGRTLQIQGFCHGSAAGIQLKHGAHAGRLLCPSRIFTGRYSTWEDAIRCCYNNSIYSDDHGNTWFASAPVQQGTGEGTLIEDETGSILYNSRGMHRDGMRLLASSTDGGETYHSFRPAEFIFEEKNIGCNASFLRVERSELPALPQGADSITLFANPRAECRRNMTICVSFDSGRTWGHTKAIWSGGSAYSSLTFDPVSGRFFLLYEKGDDASNPYKHGVAVLEFDLDWLLSE